MKSGNTTENNTLEMLPAYKGFDKDLKCRDFQYELGGEYHEDNANLCHAGFHACEYPLDCFSYYPPGTSRYCSVELGEVSGQKDSDSKLAGKHIRIGAEIGIKGIVEASVKFALDKADWKNAESTNTGDQSVATNTGYQSAASVDGEASVAITTGIEGEVKGALGCAIVAVERGKWDGCTHPIIAIRSAVVDGETIKADVWYTVKDGKWAEVQP